jgi:hypothetical protein
VSHCDVDGVLAVLERTPGALRAMLEGAPESLITADEGEDTFSPFDVVGHLIIGDQTDWIPRLRNILTEGDARRFDPFDRFAQFEASRGKTIDDLLDEFEGLRHANVETLRGLLAEGFDMGATGTHPELGRATAGELLSTWATHDLGHIAQVARVMAKHFGKGAGPWSAYLPILRDRS